MSSPINLENLQPGFQDPVSESQAAFRCILDCFAHPGKRREISSQLQPHSGIDLATAAVCLTLFDHETTVWLDRDDQGEFAGWLRFHCQCPITEHRESADFAVVTNPQQLTDLDRFRLGEPQRPDCSTTLILQTGGFEKGTRFILRGPGIEESAELTVNGVAPEVWSCREQLFSQFPLGIDMILTSGETLVSLPRTTETGSV